MALYKFTYLLASTSSTRNWRRVTWLLGRPR